MQSEGVNDMSKQMEEDDQFADSPSDKGGTPSELLSVKPTVHDDNSLAATSVSASRENPTPLLRDMPSKLCENPPAVPTKTSHGQEAARARPLVQPKLPVWVNKAPPASQMTATNSLQDYQHEEKPGLTLQEPAAADLPKNVSDTQASPPVATPLETGPSPELAALEHSFRKAQSSLAPKPSPVATPAETDPSPELAPIEHSFRKAQSSLAPKPPPVATAPPTKAALPQSESVKNKDTKPAPKKTKKKRPTHDNVQVIEISSIETQVCRAARLVAHELENGAWPEIFPGARRQAATALEEFAKTIFLPNLLQADANQTIISNERVFLATVLALREVLTQNARHIFRIQDVNEWSEEPGQQQDTAAPGAKRRKRQDQEEERQYIAQLFGTGVVFAAIQSTPEAESCLARFTELMDSYDTGDGDFYAHMKRLDGRHAGVTPHGKTLSSEENVAWKVSFNRALELHPVVCRGRQRVEQSDEVSHSIQVPTPNAVFVSMVEQTPRR